MNVGGVVCLVCFKFTFMHLMSISGFNNNNMTVCVVLLHILSHEHHMSAGLAANVFSLAVNSRLSAEQHESEIRSTEEEEMMRKRRCITCMYRDSVLHTVVIFVLYVCLYCSYTD